MVGPFIFFDQMGPAQLLPGSGIDVRPHPHINLSTVTYLFDGAIGHRDSLGSDLVIEPGAVNLMTAGHGIVHSERSPSEARPQGPVLSGIQTAGASRSAGGNRPGVRACPRRGAASDRGAGRDRASHHGGVVGTECADDDLCRHHLCRHRAGAGRERARGCERRGTRRLLRAGRGQPGGHATGAAAALYPEAGDRDDLAVGARWPGDAVRGDAFTTPRHVWWNFVSSVANGSRRPSGRGKRASFRPCQDDLERIEIPEIPKTVSYP